MLHVTRRRNLQRVSWLKTWYGFFIFLIPRGTYRFFVGEGGGFFPATHSSRLVRRHRRTRLGQVRAGCILCATCGAFHKPLRDRKWKRRCDKKSDVRKVKYSHQTVGNYIFFFFLRHPRINFENHTEIHTGNKHFSKHLCDANDLLLKHVSAELYGRWNVSVFPMFYKLFESFWLCVPSA